MAADEKKLPLVVAKITIESWHEKVTAEPDHSTEIIATYRGIPEAGLLALEKVAANAITQMTEFGEARLEQKKK